MGTVKVTNIEPIADNGTVTLGSSGDTFALASGAKQQLLRPAFLAYRATNQSSVSDATLTKVQHSTEAFDTDSAYDNSTNYRFTVPTDKAGKYVIYHCIRGADFSANRLISILQKNGSTVSHHESENSNSTRPSSQGSVVLDLSAGDYIENFVYIDSGATRSLLGGGSGVFDTFFGGYRIGD